jgi:hypothetical protein
MPRPEDRDTLIEVDHTMMVACLFPEAPEREFSYMVLLSVWLALLSAQLHSQTTENAVRQTQLQKAEEVRAQAIDYVSLPEIPDESVPQEQLGLVEGRQMGRGEVLAFVRNRLNPEVDRYDIEPPNALTRMFEEQISRVLRQRCSKGKCIR